MRGVVGVVAGIYVLLIGLLNIPAVQRHIAGLTARELSKRWQTEVYVGRINPGLLNRIVIDDVRICDREGKELLQATRAAAKFEWLPLFHGRVAIDNIQLFGFRLNLYRQRTDSPPNYQFLLDAFASDDTTSSAIDLRIRSLLVRRGEVQYHLQEQPYSPGRFNPAHLHLTDIRLTASLKAFTPDSVNMVLKSLSFKEASGLDVQRVALRFSANRRHAELSGLEVVLPGTELGVDSVVADYAGLPSAGRQREWLHSLRYKGSLTPSRLTPSDWACFVPACRNADEPLFLRMDFSGSPQHTLLRNIHVFSRERDIELRAESSVGLTDNDEMPVVVTADIDELTLKASADRWLPLFLTEHRPAWAEGAARLAPIQYRGTASYSRRRAVAEGTLHTAVGQMRLFGSLTDGHLLDATADGSLSGLTQIWAQKGGTPVPDAFAFDVKVRGNVSAAGGPEIQASGRFSDIDFLEHRYGAVNVETAIRRQIIEGRLTVEDVHGRLQAEGEMSRSKTGPYVRLTAVLEHFNPHALHLTQAYPSTSFSGRLQTDIRGRTWEDVSGSVCLTDFRMQTDEGLYRLNDIRMESAPDETGKHLRLTSDFVTAQADGPFRYATLGNALRQTAHRHLPSLFTGTVAAEPSTDALHFRLRVLNTEPFQKIGNLPLYIAEPGVVEGELNATTGALVLTGAFPEVEYGNEHLTDVHLSCSSDGTTARADVSLQRLMSGLPVHIGLSAEAVDDRLRADLSWDNHRSSRYAGVLSTTTRFHRTADARLEADTRIHPTQIVINDTTWNMHAASVAFRGGAVHIDSFLVSQRERHLAVNGTASHEQADTLTADLKDINLQYVFNIINFHAVEFGGEATGRIVSSGLLNAPTMDAHLNVRRFTFNGGDMGLLNAHARWDSERRGIVLQALMNDAAERHTTHVDGTIIPGHGPGTGLDLNIRTQRINLYFLNQYTSGIFTNFRGRATGWARVFGPFKRINVEGDLLVNEARMRVNALNVDYRIENDSVILRPDNIWIRQARVYDNEGNPGRDDHYAVVDGHMQHDFFSNLRYRFDIGAHNVLGYDRSTFGDEVFYGTVYATGRIGLSGRPGELNVDINARPEKQTTFTYNASTPETLTDNRFLRFRPAGETDNEVPNGTEPAEKAEEEAPTTDMRLNFVLDITPDATMKILMDAQAGDYIALNGYGNIRASYYNKGRFMMYGTYRVDHGVYKLSVQDVIRKDFQFRPGGTLVFGGEPFQADLNLQAVYTVPSVSLNDLSSHATFSQSNVRVNCLMNLGGKARNPQISFDFDIPNVNEDEKQMVRSLISTEEEKNMQVIYLLGIGRFYTYDYNNTDQSQSSVAMKSLLSSTLSGQLNQALSTIIGSNNWNFGTNLSTGETGWSDMDVEGLLSGRLLNNRLLINGNFGYRDNSTTASNFVGDFDLQWLLTRNGNVSLKAYSETNDRYFTKSALTTQGIGILLKKDFNTWRDLFRLSRRRTATPANQNGKKAP